MRRQDSEQNGRLAFPPQTTGAPHVGQRCERGAPDRRASRGHPIGRLVGVSTDRRVNRPSAWGYTPAMKTGLIVIAVILLAAVGALVWGVGVNNDLVRSEVDVNEKWAQVQNVYQRRADLVPNLVETVKGFAAQERTVLEEVTKARASVAGMQGDPRGPERPQGAPEVPGGPGSAGRSAQPASRHRGALPRTQVQPELPRPPEPARGHREPDRRRAPALQRGGARVQHAPARFPASMVASFRGFKDKAFFEAAAGSEAAPKVKF